MDNKWKQDLEFRAEMVRNQEHLRPAPVPAAEPRRVDMNDPDSRAIRRALLDAERRKNQRVIIWLAVGLVASLAANAFQGMLYKAVLSRLC